MNLGVARRAAFLADKACACGSTDRLRAMRPPGAPSNFWNLGAARLAEIVPTITVKCWECLCRDLCAARGVRRNPPHGTRTRYRYGCRCAECGEAERTSLAKKRVRKSTRRSPRRPWEETP